MGEETKQNRIIAWIDANTPFTLGTTLQANYFADNAPERCVMIRETGGNQDMSQVKQEIMVQVISRSRAPDEARADAYSIYEFLYKNGHLELPVPPAAAEFLIELIEPVNTPQYLGRDEKFRHQYSTNYKFTIFIKGGK